MMQHAYRICAVALFVFFLSVLTVRAAPSRREIAEYYRHAVVRVEAHNVEDKTTASGVFYTQQKLITNAHVIGDRPTNKNLAERVYEDRDIARYVYSVVFQKKRYPARLIGRDPDIDFAILETEDVIPGITPAPIGDSDTIRAGDEVYVIGNPFGLNNTVTAGIVSNVERDLLPVQLSYKGSIQTNAEINFGNSGGAMVSLETGELVGIPTVRKTGADGIAFAIPINVFVELEGRMRGTIRHSWVGIQFPGKNFVDDEGILGLIPIHLYTGFRSIKTLEGVRHELFQNGGVLITSVFEARMPGLYFALWPHPQDTTPLHVSPARRAGLKTGDIIRVFDGIQTNSRLDLVRALFLSTPYEETRMQIVRFTDEGGQEKLTLPITPIIRNPEGIEAGYY